MKKKPERKKKDLTLRDVEKVKDDLARHLKEIKKLIRTNKDDEASSDDDQGIHSDESEESSDAEEDKVLNRRIGNLKKMVNHHAKMLKGEEPDGHDYDDRESMMLDAVDNGDDENDEEYAAELLEQKK